MQLTIYNNFSDLPDSLSQLFTTAEEKSIFFSQHWFELLANTCLANHERVRVYAVFDDNEKPLACLPCYHVEGQKHLHALENFYSSLFALIGQNDAAMQHIAEYLGEEKWHSITLKPMPQDETFSRFQQELHKVGFKTQGFFCFGNWYLRMQGRNFDDYYNALSSKLKNTIKRRHKKLDKETQNRIELIRGDSDLDKYIEDFISIYNRSWKEPEPFVDFIPNFIRLCQRQGWLRMGFVYVDDKPAAAQLWTVHAGIAYIYKLAYDEAFSRYSTGSILTKHLMQWVIDEDKVEEVDYLTGDDNYKKDWMSHRRERWGIAAYNIRTIKGLYLAAVNIGGQKLKRLFVSR